jgi:CDP-glucose 4,6-dehydratase
VGARNCALEVLDMNREFWRGKRVLITGHTGFKGSWLSLWLQSLGCEVTGYALPSSTAPNLFEMARVAAGMRSVLGDVRDAQALSKTVMETQPEIVFHLAAQALVRQSYRDPVETFQTNVMGTTHLLEAVRVSKGVKAVVNVTTDKCYENREWIWPYREDEALGGHDPYSASKACSELVTSAYRRSFFANERYAEHGVALASARAGNVIGGGDWSADRLIPDTIRAFSQGEVVQIRYPNAVRPWQHVLDPLAGYLMLAQRLYEDGPPYAQAWNFGPAQQDAQAVKYLVEQMAALWGQGARYEVLDQAVAHEAHTLRLDTTKAQLQLGWQPRIPLSRALNMTLDWVRQTQSGAQASELCQQQIQSYSSIQ